MTTSDQISLFALLISGIGLLVSVVGAVINFWYTRRTFAATHIPVLYLGLSVVSKHFQSNLEGAVYSSKFGCHIANLSDSVSIANVKITLILQAHRFHFPLRRRGIQVFQTKEYAILGPREEHRDLLDSDKTRLEWFLTDRIHTLLRRKELNVNSGILLEDVGFVSTGGKPIDYHEILSSRPVYWTLTAKYDLGVTGSKRQTMRKRLRLTPVEMKHINGLTALSDWKLEEL